MTVKPAPRNVGASVRQRLLNLSRAGGPPFDILLTRYVLERLLYRLTLTPHAGRFVLKGAMLVTTWFADPHRQTRDVDLLGFGSPTPDAMLAVFREVCSLLPGPTEILEIPNRLLMRHAMPVILHGD